MDPCALYAPNDELRSLINQMLQQFSSSRYIVNLGHGIYPDVDPDKVKLFVDQVHKSSTDERPE
ncbi:unnamed protein product [Echinostoma caproni]|uniref:Uroporphyrinogen decarboxylase (URO-D) domain-containing protein n=1 Tax=Echinostoma caproni TaxID=27848 RepID=A0A3P8L2Q0_9TREM|nr:unnamed protein product [Echinostoma caproni]